MTPLPASDAPGVPRLLALDWGTSSLRAYLLGDAAQPCAERRADWGIMHLPAGGFAAALKNLCGDWLLAYPQLPIIAAGMVGSAQGWVEAPYVAAPASLEQLAARLAFADAGDGRKVAIVPGVLCDGALPDLMRGEETQVFGALAHGNEVSRQARLIVLPGTHSKWVRVQGESLAAFKTFMTGETYALLCRHSILGRLMEPGNPAAIMDVAAFERGLDEALRPEGRLLGCLFSVRALGLTGKLRPDQLGDYLSGLLIGNEIREALAIDGLQCGAPPELLGDAALCERYRLALSRFGIPDAAILPPATTPAGLWAVAQAAGLLDIFHSLPC